MGRVCIDSGGEDKILPKERRWENAYASAVPFGPHSSSLCLQYRRKSGGQSRNAAVGPPFKTLRRTRGRDGEDEPILQNAVYENIGEYNKVVYVFVHEREQAPPARRRGVDMQPKGLNLLPVSHDGCNRSGIIQAWRFLPSTICSEG
jgi:hypothetical protein